MFSYGDFPVHVPELRICEASQRYRSNGEFHSPGFVHNQVVGNLLLNHPRFKKWYEVDS